MQCLSSMPTAWCLGVSPTTAIRAFGSIISPIRSYRETGTPTVAGDRPPCAARNRLSPGIETGLFPPGHTRLWHPRNRPPMPTHPTTGGQQDAVLREPSVVLRAVHLRVLLIVVIYVRAIVQHVDLARAVPAEIVCVDQIVPPGSTVGGDDRTVLAGHCRIRIPSWPSSHQPRGSWLVLAVRAARSPATFGAARSRLRAQIVPTSNADGNPLVV